MNIKEFTKNGKSQKGNSRLRFGFLMMMLSMLTLQQSFAQTPTTQLRSIDCGKINLTPVAQIACMTVTNANLYQWEFRDINTNAIVGTKNTTGVVFYPGMVNFLNWNTQYHCAIRARVGSTFGSFGPSCIIGLMENPSITGVPPTTLRPQFCSAPSLLLASTVSCMPVPMGTLYKFEFTNTITQQVTTVTLSTNYLNLNHPTLALQIGQTYEVRTSAFVFNTWSNVTSSCIVSIELPLTNVTAGYIAPACMASSLGLTVTFQGGVGPITYAWTGPNGYHSAIQNPVVLNPANGTYSVTVTGSFGSGSGSSSTSVFLNPAPMVPVITGGDDFCTNNIATLDAGPGYDSYLWSNGMQTQTTIALLAGTYTVIVGNSFGCTTTASVVIPACFSNVASTQVRVEDCGVINFTPDAEFLTNEVINATNYQWEFRNPSTLALYATYTGSSNAIFSDLVSPTLQFNTQYVTRVRAEVAGEWGNYGALCIIGLAENPAITGVLPTQIRSQYCDITLPLDSTIACEPVSMGTLYEFEFTDLSNATVTTMTVNLVYLELSSVLPSLIGGHTYSVRARGFVYNTWSDFGVACNITISNLPNGAEARESASEINVEFENKSSLSSNFASQELLAYPNPFENHSGFIVKSNENTTVSIYLFDAVGKIMWSKQTITNQYEQFNTQDLAPGLYFMSTSENKNKAVKIIKSK